MTLLFAAMQAMPIDWKLPDDYEDQRNGAQQRISHRDLNHKNRSFAGLA